MLNTRKQQKEHRINLNRKKIAVLLLVSHVMVALIAGVGVYADSISNIQTIGEGVAGSFSYTVYPYSGNTYAKDQNGIVEYTDTDLGSVLNSIIADNQGGCNIKLLGNTEYDVAETVEFTTSTYGASYVLEGGGYSTVLAADGNLDAVISVPSTGSYLTLKNLKIDGNSYTVAAGLNVSRVYYNLESVMITDCTAGLNIFSGSNGYSVDCDFYLNDYGVLADEPAYATDKTTFTGCTFSYNAEAGIYLDGGSSDNVRMLNFENNKIEANYGHGIYVLHGKWIRVINNHFEANNIGGGNTGIYDVYTNDVTGLTVSYNEILKDYTDSPPAMNTDYCIYVYAPLLLVNVEGNEIGEGTTGAVYVAAPAVYPHIKLTRNLFYNYTMTNTQVTYMAGNTFNGYVHLTSSNSNLTAVGERYPLAGGYLTIDTDASCNYLGCYGYP